MSKTTSLALVTSKGKKKRKRRKKRRAWEQQDLRPKSGDSSNYDWGFNQTALRLSKDHMGI
jgi:hypothetical protein